MEKRVKSEIGLGLPFMAPEFAEGKLKLLSGNQILEKQTYRHKVKLHVNHT